MKRKTDSKNKPASKTSRKATAKVKAKGKRKTKAKKLAKVIPFPKKKKPLLPDVPIGWTPQEGPQDLFCRSGEFEVFYGGSAGGGKSDALLAEGARDAWHESYRGIIFRRKTPQLKKLIDRSNELFPGMFPGCSFKESRRFGLHWQFLSGARLYFAHLENEKDKFNHDGQEYQYIGFDEVQHFTLSQYKYMYSRARSSHKDLKPRIRSSGMPIGPGIGWVKDRFIGNGAFEVVVDEESGLTRKFVPANLDDNQILMRSDPQYERALRLMGKKLYHALRYGDWDSIEGASFEELNKIDHQMKPHEPPPGTPVYRCLDWGYAKPFSIGWYYLNGDGHLIRFKEWYAWGGEPDKGLRKESRDVARKILEIDERYEIAYGIADPAIWSTEDGPSIAKNMKDVGVEWKPAVNDRINGKIEFHTRLQGEDGIPWFYVTEDCKHWWRTVPMLQADSNRAEDVDTKMEDHAYDESRYMMMNFPISSYSGEIWTGNTRATANQNFN